LFAFPVRLYCLFLFPVMKGLVSGYERACFRFRLWKGLCPFPIIIFVSSAQSWISSWPGSLCWNRSEQMAISQNDILKSDIFTKWHFYKMTFLQNDIFTKWHFYKMSFYKMSFYKMSFYKMTVYKMSFYKMTFLQNDIFTKWHL